MAMATRLPFGVVIEPVPKLGNSHRVSDILMSKYTYAPERKKLNR